MEYAILEREVQTNQELYNTLLGKIKEVNILEELPKTNLRLVERASVPTHPVRPKKLLNLTLSVVLGLFIGLGLALLLELMDQSFHNRREVEQYLNLPVLSEIPMETDGLHRSKRVNKPKPLGPELNILSLPLNTPYVEAMSMLATSLRFSAVSRPRGAYLVTSAVPLEGKSTTAYNLGVKLSDQGLKVLVVEADLRLPDSRRIKELIGREGLADILIETFDTQIREGILGELSVGDIHKLLEVQERSGTIYYESETDKFKVYFRQGKIIDVDWLTRPPEGRLGNLLIRSGLITEEQMNVALEKQKGTPQQLGQVLLALGFLRIEQLAGALKLLMQENLAELYRCQEAVYHFKEETGPGSGENDAIETALIEALGETETRVRPVTPFLSRKIKRCAVRVEDTSVWIMTRGKRVHNPSGLLASKRMRALVELCRAQYDVLLFDSPPAAGIGDAAILSSLCDGVVMLIKAGRTHITEARRAKEHLESVPTPIAGAVLNMLDFEKDPYYYSRYYYKYSGYYSSSTKREKERARSKKGRIWSRLTGG